MRILVSVLFHCFILVFIVDTEIHITTAIIYISPFSMYHLLLLINYRRL